MPIKKREKTSNFASEGRVMGTGDIKAPRQRKLEVKLDHAHGAELVLTVGQNEDGGADYKPPVDEGENEGEEIEPAPKRRKSEEIESEAYVPIKSREPRKTMKATKMQRELLELHKDAKAREGKSTNGEIERSTVEKAEKEGEKATEGDTESNVVAAEQSELRSGRSKDAFINKHGQGRTLG